MRYVMVPVPSEFVLDVMRMVIFRAPDDDEVSDMRDESRLVTLLREADDGTRALLALVARATNDNEQLRFSDAADELEVDGDALRAQLAKLNAEALGGGRQLIGITDEIAVRVHGNVGRNRYLVMRPEHARMVRAIARRTALQDS